MKVSWICGVKILRRPNGSWFHIKRCGPDSVVRLKTMLVKDSKR
jgi:hypothetical protein